MINPCGNYSLNYKVDFMAYIHMITGGERSGKSTYAERLALEDSPNPIYFATARIWDEEFRERVRLHQVRRGAEWDNIEEEKYPSRHQLSGRTVLFDCVTLWGTNFFFDHGGEVEPALSLMKEEFERLLEQDIRLIVVTNEIGLGGVSADATQRRFTSLQGWFNQYLAERADKVTLMVSGIPLSVK